MREILIVLDGFMVLFCAGLLLVHLWNHHGNMAFSTIVQLIFFGANLLYIWQN